MLLVPGILIALAQIPSAAAGLLADSTADLELADLSLERLMEVRIEKVIGASKFEQKVTQAPASVTVVTGDEIARMGHRTVADVLRSVRGLYLSYDGNYSYLGSRGFLRPGDYNSRTLVLIDGHAMNDNLFGSAGFGREYTVATGDIDRVEVIRGPSSSIYGSSAFFGVVNIITHRGRQLNGWGVSAETGSYGASEAGLSFGKLFKNGLELYVSATYFRSPGQKSIYYPEFDQRIFSTSYRATNNGVAEDSDAEDAFKLLTNLRFGKFTVSGFFVTRDKTVPTAAFVTDFNTQRQKTIDRRGYLSVGYEHQISGDLRVTGHASYDTFWHSGDNPYNLAPPGFPPHPLLSTDQLYGDWLTTEWQMTASILEQHTVIVGAEFRNNLHQQARSYIDGDPNNYYFDSSLSSKVAGVYAQTEVAIAPTLTFNGGARYDYYYSSFGGTLNPRFALIYHPAPRTTLKALYGQAFRAPNQYEQYYGSAAARQSPLRPERIRTFEVVLEHYFTGDYRFGISAYKYKVNDLIAVVILPDGDFTFANTDRSSAKGVELEFEGRYGHGVHVRTSYALQHARDETTGNELTSSPRHLAKLNVIIPLYKDRLTTGLELQYNSSVRTLAGGTADDFLIGNITFTAFQPAKGITLSLSLYNVMNTRYGYPGSGDHLQDVLIQEGRTGRAKLSWRF